MGILTHSNEVYETGKQHFHQGLKLHDNPYKGNTEDSLAWIAGWKNAEFAFGLTEC